MERREDLWYINQSTHRAHWRMSRAVIFMASDHATMSEHKTVYIAQQVGTLATPPRGPPMAAVWVGIDSCAYSLYWIIQWTDTCSQLKCN